MESAFQLLERVKLAIRAQQLSSRTEAAYCDWIFRYFLFNGKQNPQDLGEPEVASFLNYLTQEGNKSASTQNQAHCALLFLYNDVLQQPLTKIQFFRRKHYRSEPAILTKTEIEVLLSYLEGVPQLVAALLYSCGLKIMEGLTLRIRDVDLGKKQLRLENRVLFFPASLECNLQAQIRKVTDLHQEDLSLGFGEADIPAAVCMKNPAEAKSLAWQYLFPAARRSQLSSNNKEIRFHLHESVLQKAVKQALKRANLNKNACCHSLRHSFAAHLLESGNDLATVQKLLGHRNKRSTLIYKYLLEQNAKIYKNQPENLMLPK